ncbi:MAG: carbamate kinase [Myxococcales bacterium]|jgi:carbamate kinase
MGDTQRVVAALGGNAFASRTGELTMAGQFELASAALQALSPLLQPRVQLLLAHGNGPQVGYILTRAEAALGAAYALPLSVCVAESEGELGYVLLQSLHNVLSELGIERPVASLLTQVLVSPGDPAFAAPSKPIGPVIAADRAEALRSRGFAVAEDRGRGLRRVVPSPEPLEVLDAALLARVLEMGAVVVAAGGGGIPVVREGGRLRGVAAVVDKDLTAALLAAALGAERLLILTDVPCAYRDFGTGRQAPLHELTPTQVRALAAEGHFPAGSMGPKMEAAARFASAPGRSALICDPPSLAAALRGEAGTRVTVEAP